MIRAVVLDIGGVLELTPPTGWRSRWERDLGLEPGEMDRRLAEVWRGGSLGTMTEEEVAAGIAERLGLDAARRDRFLDDFWDEYLGTADSELIAWARGLRPGVATGILSNSFVGARERESARYGFDRLVDVVVYSHEVGLAKPDPAVYRLVCARLDVRPEEAVFLDDVPQAVAAARAVGMAAVLFGDNAQAMAEIEALLAP